jgi:hypothetical protein
MAAVAQGRPTAVVGGSFLGSCGASRCSLPKIGFRAVPRPLSKQSSSVVFRTIGVACQSALMPANFTTLAHFSVSSAMSLPNVPGGARNPLPAGAPR